MFQKDYLMRLIEQFTVGLARIIAMKSADKIAEKQQAINELINELTGLSEAGIERLSSGDLIDLVSGFQAVNPEKCFMLSEMLKLKADVLDSLGEGDQAFSIYLKSFNMYLTVLLNYQSSYLAPNDQTIEQIISKIKRFKLPDETQKALFLYYERMKRYDLAENILFERLADNVHQNQIISEGIAFYERLMIIDPEALAIGNLPIDEVLESMEKIRNLDLEG